MSALIKTFESIALADQLSLRWIAERRKPLFDRIMRGFTHAGDWQTWTLTVLIAVLAGGHYRLIAFRIAPKLILTLGTCYAIKAILRRPRPSRGMLNFTSLLENPDPYSFPSSHTACVWVVCVSLGIALGWGWPVWMAYATVISYSRVHVGAHYPLDVFIGASLGVAIAVLF